MEKEQKILPVSYDPPSIVKFDLILKVLKCGEKTCLLEARK
jgi:hypothetical protein